MEDQSPYADALEVGWAAVVVDDFNPEPLVPTGWKAYKYEVPAFVDKIPQAPDVDRNGNDVPAEAPKHAVTRRYAYLLYDPERWVWAGQTPTDTCIFASGGKSWYLHGKALTPA